MIICLWPISHAICLGNFIYLYFYLLPNLLLIQNRKGSKMSFLENQFSKVVLRTLHTCEVLVTDVIFKFYISSLECDCCTVTSIAIHMLFLFRFVTI